MDIPKLTSLIETLIFVAEKPISLDHIKIYLREYADEVLEDEDFEQAIDQLRERHGSAKSGMRLEEIADGFQLMSSEENFELVKLYLKELNKRRLSKTALETLSIIAYKQPTTKSEIEQIRGVSSDYMIQKLLEKELVEIKGRSEGPGRPLLYVTTQKFMDHFGIKSIKDLPKLSEFEMEENSVGTPQELKDEEE